MNAGTGQPNVFRCLMCRQLRRHTTRTGREPSGSGYIDRVSPTGRERPTRRYGGVRSSGMDYEYRCIDCGHTGWSRHIEIKRLYVSR